MNDPKFKLPEPPTEIDPLPGDDGLVEWDESGDWT